MRLVLAGSAGACGGPSNPRCLSPKRWSEHGLLNGQCTVYMCAYSLLCTSSRGLGFYLLNLPRPQGGAKTAGQAHRRAWNSLQATQPGVTRLAAVDTGCAFQPFHHPHRWLRETSVVCRKSVCWPATVRSSNRTDLVETVSPCISHSSGCRSTNCCESLQTRWGKGFHFSLSLCLSFLALSLSPSHLSTSSAAPLLSSHFFPLLSHAKTIY
jgi:hypothetical protein